MSSSRPRAFRSVQQAGDRPVDLAGVLLVPLLQVAVLVPLHDRVAVRDLDEPHAALGEAAGQQALAAEVRGDGVVQAVEPAASPATRRERSSISGISVCMRKASSNESMRPSRAWSGPVCVEVVAVHLARAGRAAAAARRAASAAFLMKRTRRLLGRDAGVAERRPLVGGRQEGRAPVVDAAVRQGRADGDEAGQVLVLGPQAVGDPRAHARAGRSCRCRCAA